MIILLTNLNSGARHIFQVQQVHVDHYSNALQFRLGESDYILIQHLSKQQTDNILREIYLNDRIDLTEYQKLRMINCNHSASCREWAIYV